MGRCSCRRWGRAIVVEQYAAQRGLQRAEAGVAVRTDLDLLRGQFEAIPLIIDEIDTRNARFSGVALRKIRYFLRQDRRTEGQLQYLVDTLARDDAPDLDLDVYRCELLAGDFLYTPPRQRDRPRPQRLGARSSADRDQIRAEAAAKLRRPYGRRRVEEFVEALLAGRSSMSMRELAVTGDVDYVRLLYLSSYGLDGNSSFRVRPSAERIRSGVYGYPAGEIKRSERRRRVETASSPSARRSRT